MAVNYKDLSRNEFDAIVTGELSHIAIWFNGIVENFICEYFFGALHLKGDDFKEMILKRESMSLNTKMEILRKISEKDEFLQRHKIALKKTYSTMDDLKRLRNAMAHGLDVGGNNLEIDVEITNSSGRRSKYTVTPTTHQAFMNRCIDELEKLERLFDEYKEL